MKIIYVFLSASKVSGSVQKKVLSEITGLINNGIDCKGLFFTTDSIDEIIQDERIKYIQVPKIRSKYFRSSKQRTAYFQTLFDYFSSATESCNFIYFRYPGAHPLLLQFMRKIKFPVFFEHVTAETEEIKLYPKENPLQLNVSSLLSQIEFYVWPLIREQFYGNLIRQKALFGICNSSDIAAYENRMANGKYKTIVIGDAVDTNNYRLKMVSPLDKEFKMIFLKGAATRADFNGLDKVMRGIKNYRGPYALKFYLYGKNLEAETQMVKDLGLEQQVSGGGFINQSESDSIYDQMHLGIGALAVHRKGLKSTSTIKTREYFSRGLPFVYGHSDPDFSDKDELLKYCYELPQNEDSLNFDEILSWYEHLDINQNIGYNMREYALKHLDYRVKMGKLVSFIQNEFNAI